MDKIKIKISDNAKLPEYAHQGDAGMDLFSCEETILKKRERKIIKTGVKMAIPTGYVGLIWDKSGLAAKKGIHIMAGVIDSSYRGEIGVVMKNLGDEDFEITKHMKIAQMLIQPFISPTLIKSDSLDDTSRAESGFGSTGTH
jgi:dUTP diphosphatase